VVEVVCKTVGHQAVETGERDAQESLSGDIRQRIWLGRMSAYCQTGVRLAGSCGHLDCPVLAFLGWAGGGRRALHLGVLAGDEGMTCSGVPVSPPFMVGGMLEMTGIRIPP